LEIMNKNEEENFVAPQNSTIEGYKIPRYTNDPFKERNSAPPTVTTTPHNSYLSLNKKKNEASVDDWWEDEYYIQESRKFKVGINVKNNLQGRLYQFPDSNKVCILCFFPSLY